LSFARVKPRQAEVTREDWQWLRKSNTKEMCLSEAMHRAPSATCGATGAWR
jgi:hypothetical protein